MRVITQRQEDFCWEVKPGFSCVAGGSRVLVSPDFCHDGKIIAVISFSVYWMALIAETVPAIFAGLRMLTKTVKRAKAAEPMKIRGFTVTLTPAFLAVHRTEYPG